MAVISRMIRGSGILALAAALLAAKSVHAQTTLCVKTFSMLVVDSSDPDLTGGYAMEVPNALNPQVNTITFTNDPTAVTSEFQLSPDGMLMTVDGLIANTDSGVNFDYFFFDTADELASNPNLVPIICSVTANRLTCGAEGNDVIQYCDGNLSIGSEVNDNIPCAFVTLETDPLQFKVCDPSTSTTLILDPTTTTSTSTVLSTSEASSTTTILSTSTVGASSTDASFPTDTTTVGTSSTDAGLPTDSTTVLSTSETSTSTIAASTDAGFPTDTSMTTGITSTDAPITTTSTTTELSGVVTLTSTILPVLTTTVMVATQTVTQNLNGSITTITSTYPIWTTTCQVGATPLPPIYPGPTVLPYMPRSNSTYATYAPHHYAALPPAMISCNKPAAPMPAATSGSYAQPTPGGSYGGNGNGNGNGYTNATSPGGNYGAPGASYPPGRGGISPVGYAPPAGTGAYTPYATGPTAYEGGAAESMHLAMSGVLAAAVLVACLVV